MSEEGTPKKITAADVNSAMDEAVRRNGANRRISEIRREAAEILGVDHTKVTELIKGNKALAMRWIETDDVKAPDEIDVMNRQQIVGVDEERRLKVLQDLERQMQKEGLKAMGLTDHEISRTLSFQSQKNKRMMFDAITRSFHGNILFTTAKLTTLLERVEARLEMVQGVLMTMATDEEFRKDLVEEERSLNLAIVAINQEIRKNHTGVFEASKIAALVDYKIKGGGPQKKAKPAFQEIGEDVVDVEPEKPKEEPQP